MRRTILQAKLHVAVSVASPSRRENEAIRQNPIPRDLLQRVREPQHLLRCAGLVTGLVGEALQGPGRRRRQPQRQPNVQVATPVSRGGGRCGAGPVKVTAPNGVFGMLPVKRDWGGVRRRQAETVAGCVRPAIRGSCRMAVIRHGEGRRSWRSGRHVSSEPETGERGQRLRSKCLSGSNAGVEMSTLSY